MLQLHLTYFKSLFYIRQENMYFRKIKTKNVYSYVLLLLYDISVEYTTRWVMLNSILHNLSNVLKSNSHWTPNECYLFQTILETRQRGRFAGFSLYISDTDVSIESDIRSSTLCYKDGTQLPPLNITITCSEYGRYVIFYNERLVGNIYPAGYELENVVTVKTRVFFPIKFR